MGGGLALDIRVNDVAKVTPRLWIWMIGATVRIRRYTKKVKFCLDTNVAYEFQLVNAYF